MNDIIDAIRQRYVAVFGNPILDVPKGCSLARHEIPSLLKMSEEYDKKFQMLGTCLAAIIAKQGGHVDVPKKLVYGLAEQYKAASKKFVMTAVSVDDIDGDMVRISIKHECVIKEENIEVPTTIPPLFRPASDHSIQERP